MVLLDQTLDQLIEHREREGRQLDQLIQQHLNTVDAIVAGQRQRLPVILQAQRDHLHQRLGELQANLDGQRLAQEMTLLVNKADVMEELDRLTIHTQEVRRTLRQAGPVGRRLDFLMQELNREANTLSSKSITSTTTLEAVDLKVLIEQMREQILNIE